MRRPASPLLHALLLSLAGFLAFGAVALVRTVTAWERLSVAGGTALLLGAMLAAWAWARPQDARSTVASAIALLGWFPLLGLGAAYALGQPLVVSHWRCGTGDVALAMLVPPFVLACLATTLAIAYAVNRVRIHGFLRAVGVAVVLASVAIVPVELARLGRIEPDAWAASIPALGELGRGEVLDDAGMHFSVEERAPPPTHRVQPTDCVLHVRRGADVGDVTLDRYDAQPCPRIRVRHDAVHGIVLVDVRQSEERQGRTIAVRARGGEWRLEDVGVRDVADVLSLPREWLVTSGLGVLLALALLLSAQRARSAWRARAPSEDAEHRGGGWIVAEGLGLRHVPSAAALPAGPVSIRVGDAPLVTYRDDAMPGALEVEPGTAAEHEERARARVTGLVVAALSVAMLATAPLWAARLGGL